MALKRCAICKEYFPEPEVKMKSGSYRHNDCFFYIPRSDLELQMEKEMNAFQARHPNFYLRLSNEAQSRIPVEVKK